MKPTLQQRLQYQFDNLMAAGAPAMIAMLGLLSLLVILVSALLLTLGGNLLAPAGAEPVGFVEAVWLSLMRTLDAGTMGGDEGWGFRILMLILPTLGGIFVISSLIGILSSAVEAKLEDLRKGRSLVLESDHTVILGWSQQIYSILSEIAIANASQKRHAIAILADRDKVEMEDDLRTRLPALGTTQVICRSGNPTDPSEIDVVSLHTARSIIILSGDAADDPQADLNVIKTILAITRHPNRKAGPYNIVAALADKANLDLARMLGKQDNLSVLSPREIIARVTAQTSRQSGLSLVYTDLINFDGDEIYFRALLQYAGQPYANALQHYQDASILGLLYPDGSAELNPPMDRVVGPADHFIVLAADDVAGSAADQAAIAASINTGAIRGVKEEGFSHTERMLFLGWNASSAAVLTEMDNYVRQGSTALIITPSAPADLPSLANIRIETASGTASNRQLLDGLNLPSYDHVIVQADPELDLQHSDAQVLVTLLHLRDIQQQSEARFNIVAEMLDVRNRDLASVTRIDDFIVSSHLVSMLMAQLSENHALLPVFTDIFDADGSEIYLKPAANYVEPGVAVNFATVVESARRLGETAIGYKLRAEKEDAGKNFGLYTNPNKSQTVTFTEKDKVIVLAQ